VTYQEDSPDGITSVITSPLRFARKVAVAVIGVTVLALGIALIVLPGPAFIVIPLGLAILATEFLWARRLLRRVREGAALVFQRRRDN
jgi:tellurite resistance protein TerC